MYQIYVDEEMFCDSRVDDLAIINPKVTLEVNKAGSFTFIIPPAHPYYDAITKRMSLIRVVRDNEEIFEGICTSVSDDFFKQRTVECEGSLTFFNDTIQRPHKYQNMTVRGLLENFVANHNAKCEAKKHFQVGIVTVTDSNDSIYCYTNYESTMECLKNDLVDDLGGFFRVRTSNGARYIDYIAESPNTANQDIRLGENLLDFDTTLDTTEIATVIIPLGATKETSSIQGLDERVGIASINGGNDYVVSTNAVQNFGWIEKVVTWENVTTPEALKRKAEAYLSDTQFENMIIEAKAVDLYFEDASIDQFKLLDKIHVISEPHGLDKYFVLTKQTINLNKPESDTITLGTVQKVSLTAQNRNDNKDILKRVEEISISSILESAQDNASQLIKDTENGYVCFNYDENGHPFELLVMDKPTKEEATKVWRWNQNGLGYSSTGYNGTYGTAITSDGQIVADFIKTGEMTADRIKGGILKLGGLNDTNGVAEIYDRTGTKIGTINNAGITMESTQPQRVHIKRNGSNYQGTGKDYIDYATFNSEKVDFYRLVDGTRVSQIAVENTEDNGSQFFASQVKNGKTYTVAISPGKISMNNPTTPSSNFSVEITDSWAYINAHGGKIDTGVVNTLGNVNVGGNLTVKGTKPRIVDTEHYDTRYLYCYEMPSPMFGDIGSAATDDDGTCYIYIDDIFAETVDCEVEYQVFLQKYGDGDLYVAERQQDYFVVKGTPNLEFGWELKAVQRDYDSMRLETYEEEENEELEITDDNN